MMHTMKPLRRPAVTPILLSLQTGTPDYIVRQDEARELATRIYPRLAQRQSMIDVFTNALIDTRYVTMPPEWYLTPHSWAEKNAITCREQLRLSVDVAARAIDEAGIIRQDISALVFVSSSAVSAPSLESYLIEALQLSPHTVRVPMFGLGCAGGVAGMSRAAELVRSGHQHVLLVAVELCSMTFVAQDESPSNFVATALFGDGAAAAVISGDWPGEAPHQQAKARLFGSLGTLIPDTSDVMGWDVLDEGLKVRFARSIPDLVTQMMESNVGQALALDGWTFEELQRFIVHPGGARVLRAYAEALNLPPEALQPSYDVLRRYGNMSSPTVLFVLAEHLSQAPQGRAIMSAMGPGFCAEHILMDFLPSR